MNIKDKIKFFEETMKNNKNSGYKKTVNTGNVRKKIKDWNNINKYEEIEEKNKQNKQNKQVKTNVIQNEEIKEVSIKKHNKNKIEIGSDDEETVETFENSIINM